MKRHSGFTLIELLIVAAIIGILTAVALPNFLNAQIRAKTTCAETEIKNIRAALESFFIDHGSYPPMDTDRRRSRMHIGCERSFCGCAIINKAYLMTDVRGERIYLTTPVAYISSLPNDPFRPDCGYGYGSNGQSYYILTSWGPDMQDGAGEELNEREYTGASFGDHEEAIVRTPSFTLTFSQALYNPSNGTSSAGDIIRAGP